MNDDIRILRDALKRYREFVEVPNGDPMEVPLYWYNSAKATYAEACSPDRIRRLLDDAERYQWLRGGSVERQMTALPNIGGRSIPRDKLRSMVEFMFWCTPEELDAAIDERKDKA